MQAIILAAGKGSRLGVHTKENTKCMLEINGITLIDHALENLNSNGIKKLILVVGYKKENLINHVGKQYKNIEIAYIENPVFDTTNNIYSLFLARNYLAEDDTLLLESDLIFEKEIIKKIINDERRSLAVVDKYESWMDGTAVELDQDDNIMTFIPKKIFRFQDVDKYFKTVNIYKFSKEFSTKSYIPFLEAYSKAMGDNEYYEQVLRVIMILENQELKAMRLNGEKWYEIDDIQDKVNAEIIFAKSPKDKLQLIQGRYGGYWRFPSIKDFCYLVNPYFPNQKIQEEIKSRFYELLSQYPSGLNTQNILAGKMFGITSDQIIVGNGAAELIRGLFKVMEGTFGMVYPTFNEYPETIGYDRIVNFIPQNKQFEYDIVDLIELAEKCDHLILLNPDNPSGNYIRKSDILNLLEKLNKKNKSLILDESFVDFSTWGESETLISQDILEKYPNLIVIKSISKSYGVPGIRLGVIATSQKNLLTRIRFEISIWNINSFGEFFLQIIGKYKNEYITGCNLITKERNRFYHRLNTIPFLEVFPSQANYFLCLVNEKYSAKELTQILLDQYDIYIKDLTGKNGIGNKEYIRIAVRDSQDNDFLIEKLKLM